ncbi:hypothetical protein [Halalkalibacter oceani]|uniref:hypothetical protein n=1 Tax=Halalkalibacter oceani TaxID=1653776 RepID=UPI0033933EF9
MTKKLEKLKEVKPLRSLEFKPEFEHLKEFPIITGKQNREKRLKRAKKNALLIQRG